MVTLQFGLANFVHQQYTTVIFLTLDDREQILPCYIFETTQTIVLFPICTLDGRVNWDIKCLTREQTHVAEQGSNQ